MKEANLIKEYIDNTQQVISHLQKEAASYKSQLTVQPILNKEAAIEAASHLVGVGLMSADNLSKKINDLHADPLGVIMELHKTASISTVPKMGVGKHRDAFRVGHDPNMKEADRVLLDKLGLL